jgi:hypothetical protein
MIQSAAWYCGVPSVSMMAESETVFKITRTNRERKAGSWLHANVGVAVGGFVGVGRGATEGRFVGSGTGGRVGAVVGA